MSETESENTATLLLIYKGEGRVRDPLLSPALAVGNRAERKRHPANNSKNIIKHTHRDALSRSDTAKQSNPSSLIYKGGGRGRDPWLSATSVAGNHGFALRWALYDAGHTGFTMITMAVMFPILFQNFWAGTMPEHLKTSRYSMTIGLASILVALMSPVLATIAQMGGLRMKLFRALCVLGVVGMASLTLVEKDLWQAASLIYIVAAVGFFGANLFYDSLLIDASTEKNRHTVSGLAFSVGYIGGVLLLGFIAVWTQKWEWLGFTEMPDPRLLFSIGAAWWLCFATPLLLIKSRELRSQPATAGGPEHFLVSDAVAGRFIAPDAGQSLPARSRLRVGSAAATPPITLRSGLRSLAETCRAFWRERRVRWFILAYFCYIDGVHTIITSAVRYGYALGFSQEDLFTALLVVQLFGIPCALAFGLLGKRFGARPVLFVALAIYVGVSFYGALMPAENISLLRISISPMFVLAALIGMVQGGVQALSRSYFSSIVPQGHEVSFFGFYSMIGRCSTILGPILISIVAVALHDESSPLFSTRAGIAVVSLLFVAGFIFLTQAGKKHQTTA